MLHPSPKTLPRREPPVEPSVDATADLTEMEHFGNLWHRGRSGWLQLIWWCSMVFIFSKNQRIQHGTNQDLSEIQNDDFNAFILATVDVWVCVKTHNHVQSVFHTGTTNSWPKNWIVQKQSQEDWFFVEHPWTSYRWHKKRNNQWTLYPIFGAWNLWLCCLTSRVYHAIKKNLEVDGSTTQNILKPPTSPCFTHLLRLYQGVSLLWSHPWTQPQIWQRWSTLAIFGIGAVQGDFSWFDGVQWCSFFTKINVFNMEPIKICPKFRMLISKRLFTCDCRCVGLRQNPQPCAEPFPHGHHEFVAQESDSAGTIARRLILCGTSMNIL